MASWLPKVKVAACNVAPVFLDTAKTVQKTVALIQEAARNKADLVVFPETHIPAFPLWSGVSAPIDNHQFFGKLAQESLLINGKEIKTLQQACAQAGIYAHIGFNERSSSSVGCLWNASVLISDEGKVLNHHRKLAPTFFEKLTWAPGDGAGLRVVDTARLGKIGSLICGENTNPLARWSLMAQGGGKQYDNVAANRTRTAAHCFEAKCFAVLCSGYMDKNMREAIAKHSPSAAETLDSLTQGASLFLDPTGAQIGDQVQGEEGIAYAEMDLNECVEPKQFHDVVGGYQRFDVFDLKVNRARRGPETSFTEESHPGSSSETNRPHQDGPQWSFQSLPRRQPDEQTGTNASLHRLKAELDGMRPES